MSIQHNVCPECGATLATDMVVCGECLAFAHDVNPWQRDYKLIAFPIALALTALIGLILRGPMQHTTLGTILGDDISLAIVGLGIYSMIQITLKSVVTRRQSAAFQVIRRLLAPGRSFHRNLAEDARLALMSLKLGPYNTLLAYNRLQWLVDSASVDASEKELMQRSMREHSETDWDSLENSFAYVQYMVWLLPSLGFLGTVWGMTGALGGFSDAINGAGGDLTFKNSLSETAQQLGVAFHTTLVGLAMVIPVLLAATACRRRAQHLLELLDRFFIRLGSKPLTFDDEPKSDDDVEDASPSPVPPPIPTNSETPSVKENTVEYSMKQMRGLVEESRVFASDEPVDDAADLPVDGEEETDVT